MTDEEKIDWKDPEKEEPNNRFGKNRYLVKVTCEKGIHNCLAWEYEHPCCDINFAYYHRQGKWWWSSDKPVSDCLKITHFAEVPKHD